METNDLKTKQNVVSIKIPKNLDRENVRIEEFPLDTFTKQKPIRELIKNGYTKEEAIADGCIVAEYNNQDNKTHIISNNKEKLDEFIEATKNGEERELRLVYYGNEDSMANYYTDLKYESGVYKIYHYQEPLINSENSISIFIQGDEINISYNKESKRYNYDISNMFCDNNSKVLKECYNFFFYTD